MINMKKLNNKGFSLVELIIVIAIMAILIGVVGTQVIPYLENSRKAKDQQVLSAWNTAAMSAYSAAAAKIDAEQNYKITINNNGNDGGTKIGTGHTEITVGGTGDATLLQNFCELAGFAKNSDNTTYDGYSFKGKMESKAGKDIQMVEITIYRNGVILVETTNESDDYSFDDIESK
jgi:prepilin-type N-terminal cleavage/methylation domain-containing protein